MNKLNSFKKFIVSALVILYDVVSLIWCYIIFSNLVYNFSLVSINENSIGIIGGADAPTTLFLLGKFLGVGFSILFILLSIAIIFLLTISTFKKQVNQKLSILLCIFLVLSLIVFMMIPAQTNVISLYILVRKLSFIRYIGVFYIVLSIAIIVINILFSIGKKKC